MKTVTLECEQTYADGKIYSEEYRLGGKTHNENGPAYRTWYESGQLQTEQYLISEYGHNLNGPAFIYYGENGQVTNEQYCIYGVPLSKAQFEARNKKPQCDGRIVVIDGVSYKLQPIEG